MMFMPFDIGQFLELKPFENTQAWKSVATKRSAVWEWNWAKPCRNGCQRYNGYCSVARRYSGIHTFRLFVVLIISLSALLPSVAQRVNTQSRPEYFIDLLVLSDVPLYRPWYDRARATGGLTRREAALADIRRYFALLIREVNDRFRTLENNTNFRLTVRPVAFHIAENASDSQWTVSAREGGEGEVDAQGVLRNLARWLVSTPGIPPHDHAMLMTGYDLVTDDAGVLFRYTVGRATVGTVCQGGGRSVSVIEDRGAFQSAHTAAHELGHSLGAGHDGTGDNCRATDRFIMAGNTEPRTAANLRNPWFFSLCSAREITRYVNVLLDRRAGSQCLRTALPQTGVPNVDGVIPGQLYTPDQQCQHIYGPRSRYCYGGNFGRLEDICTSMFCLKPRQGQQRELCVEYHAAHGTSCAPGRWCEAGACIVNQQAPRNIAGGCPFGDQLTLVNGQRCPAAVRAQPAACYNPRVRRICCATCARARSNIPGCPFGDRARGCRARLCNTLLPDGTPYGRNCCGTCNFVNTRWTCVDAPEGVNGLPCETAVRQGQVQGCYNATLAFSCCRTCQDQRIASAQPGCEYGNLLLENCENRTNTVQTCNRQLRWQCCKTCSDNDVIRRDVRYGLASSGHSHQVLQSTLQVLMWCIPLLMQTGLLYLNTLIISR